MGSGGERTPRVAPSALAHPGGDAQIRVRGAGGLQHPLTDAGIQPASPPQRSSSSVRRLLHAMQAERVQKRGTKTSKAGKQATTNACSLDGPPTFVACSLSCWTRSMVLVPSFSTSSPGPWKEFDAGQVGTCEYLHHNITPGHVVLMPPPPPHVPCLLATPSLDIRVCRHQNPGLGRHGPLEVGGLIHLAMPVIADRNLDKLRSVDTCHQPPSPWAKTA